ncbi:uncharacterized protein AKAME5_002894000 [Lates japonicus]|uniref:Uncharacterized protein n=1 Tax=Lates japonicus TaxID=270547 RepID=A0AAD3MU18_LATJO|nr:uncharacterized protein AKAME5_002894000 [Lates japonicus]
MSHIPSKRPPTECPAEHESIASASGISHSPVMLPQLSLPPVKGHKVSGSTEGQVPWGSAFSLPAAS